MDRVIYIRSSNIFDDSRATKEIMVLLDNNYEVVVLGWNRCGNALEKCNEAFKNVLDRCSFVFFNEKVEGGLGIKNINKLASWVKWTKQEYKKRGPFNYVHACNLDAALGVFSLAKKNGCKLIYDIYDYYVDSHSIPRLLCGMIEKMEINIINKADLTIICTEERREQISKSNPKNIVVIHNSPEVLSVNEVECKYDYVYCGSLFGQRLIKETFDNYAKNSDLKFQIAGYGEYEKYAIDLAEKYENFTFYGPVSYSRVLEIEKQTKTISAIYEPTIRNHRLCAPNKFYEALALAKPVIVCKGTGIDKIVEKYGVGKVIEYDAEQLYSAIRELIADEVVCKEMGQKARKLYESEYSWTIMKSRLIEKYNDI